MAETKQKEITLSHEHEDYKWCTLNEAIKLLKYDHHKDLFKKAHNLLIGGLQKYINK